MTTIRVPATTANLGPGFDCLGLALELYLTVEVEPAETFSLVVAGEGEGVLPTDESNLIWRAALRYAEAVGEPLPPLALRVTNGIPLGRGLGSSAAAIVAGLLCGRTGCQRRLERAGMLRLATAIEGHPDNVAAALYGGLTVAVDAHPQVAVVRLDPPSGLRAVLFIPDAPLSTEKARAALPAMVPFADAVHNVGRAALMVAGVLAGDRETLRIACDDRLHQQYRAPLIPGLEQFLAAAPASGALAAWLSGAGTAVLALVDEPDVASRVAESFMAVARAVPVAGHVRTVGLCRSGPSLPVGRQA